MGKKKKGPTPPRKWQPLGRGVPTGITLDADSDEVWVNDRYIIHVDYADAEEGRDGFLHVSLRNRANTAWAHDWRDLQRIKNEIAGPEREACELYPAESRLVDEANQFHLWVLPEGEVSLRLFPAPGIRSGRDAE